MARNTPLDPIVIADLRGGRNDTDPPMSLPSNQATEFLNCDWKDTPFGRKRGGSASLSLTGGSGFASGLHTILRHVPGADETAAQFWGFDNTATIRAMRLNASATFADVTLDDNVSTRQQDIVGTSFNGKLFLGYDSTVDRLHVFDPDLASPRVRVVGLKAPTAAPTIANTGGGAYPATLRYYRVRWIQASAAGSGTLFRRSEPSASVSFTPSGGGTGARVTQPTPPGEGETHWEVEASTDNAAFYRIAGFDTTGGSSIAIATTFLDDTTLTSAYTAQPLSEVAGFYGLFPSVKFLMTDGNRLLGGGAWETSGATSSGMSSTIWFTPVLGSADRADDERVPNTTTQKNRLALNERDGGALTGCGGPLNGIPYWFKYRSVWRLRPTGDVVTPYLPRKIRDDIGCIAHKSIAIGEDEVGRPALYFLSHRGPYRITLDGDIQYLGRDNEVTWRSMNLAASSVVAHSLYHPDRHQWRLWIATASSNEPDVCMVFDVQNGFPDQNGQVRGGWAKYTGPAAGARCSCLFSATVGATMSRDLKPYIGRATGVTILKLDTTDTDDAGTAFAASITTRPLHTTVDLPHKVGIGESTLIGTALAGSDVTVTITRDFGKETRAHSVSLAPAASETRVVKKVEGSEMGEADVIQVTVGDASANTEVWSIDAIIAPVIRQEAR